MKAIAAIDPGQKGAIAILTQSGDLVEIYSMPLRENNKLVDGAKISSILSYHGAETGVIEKVHAMPRQGVVSMFTFGSLYGGAYALLSSQCQEVAQVQPMQWKRHFNLVGKDKSASKKIAAQLWPGDSKRLLKARADVSEAALIGLYWIQTVKIPVDKLLSGAGLVRAGDGVVRDLTVPPGLL